MKKIVLFVTVCALMSSCSFLNQNDPDSFDESKFYKTQTDLETLLGSSYEAYRAAVNQMFFATEMKSDNAGTTDFGSSGGLYGSFSTHNVNSSNSIVANLYTNLCKMNHRANLVLSHINDCKWDSGQNKARVQDEAKFMRALGHFYMTTLWGKTVKMDVIFSTKDATEVSRSSVDDIYAFIIQDLQAVIKSGQLPKTYAAGDEMYGHATLTAAYALLGRVCLQYAAISNKPEYYTNAITALNAIVGDAPTLDTYANVFDVTKKQNSEIIFAVQYMATTDQSSPFCTYFEPLGAKGLTTYGTGRGWNAGLNNLAAEFNAQTATDGRMATALVKHTSGTYYTKKFADKTNYAGYGGNNWYELRFADVYLMLAEAYERTEDGESENAIKYLDLVRTRQGNNLEGYKASKNDPTYDAKCPTLRDAIFHERRLEFCFENLRWFDLARLYPDKNNFANYMRSIVDDSPAASNKFTDFAAYEVLLPIPFDELYLNPGLGQNDGY